MLTAIRCPLAIRVIWIAYVLEPCNGGLSQGLDYSVSSMVCF
jgi:hypothetical protein